ncbi:MAG: DUF4249 domain-containing protein [Bacteroidota bacterium]
MKNILKALLVFLVVSSCEETIIIDSGQADPVIIVEGLITDQNQFHYVRVTRTVDFYDTVATEPITDALVFVQDSRSNFRGYSHNPSGSPDLNGYYISNEQFAGQVGVEYTVSVTVGDEVYTGKDLLNPVTAIDSLSVDIDEDEFEDPEDEGYFYEVLFYAKEPQDRKDFYLFKFYRNDSLLRDESTDIYFSDDDLLAEEINGVPTAGYYTIGDMAKVEMYSISRNGFLYYNDLTNLLLGDGGFFGSPPVNPRTNITNGGLGFFQASSVVMDEIFITGD